MRYIIGVFVLFCSSIIYAQQITGTVVDNNGFPIEGIIVKLKNVENSSLTDANGFFSIEKIRDKNILKISGLGFRTKEIEINQNNLGEIILYEGIELLDVQVDGTRANKFSRKETAYVGKMPLKDMETATVYSTITNEVLESQVVTTIDDALVNATGIAKLWESTGRSPILGTGYFSTRGFSTQPGLVDGLPGATFSSVDPSYIERIEVIKGPSATLFGSTETSLGGLINIVTKKPYKGFGGDISYTAGSFDLHRITADVNAPISKKEDLYFRLNTSYLTQNSFQDAGFRKTFFVAPSLSYRVNNKLNLSVGVEYVHNDQTNPTMIFIRSGMQSLSNTPKEMGLNPNKSFTSDDVSLKSQNLNIRAIADYKFSDQWTSQTLVSSTNGSVDGYYQYMSEGATTAFFAIPDLLGDNAQYVEEPLNTILGEAGNMLQQNIIARLFDYRDSKAAKQNIQQNFIGDFKIGNMRNRLVFGLDYVHRSSENDNKSGNPTLAQTAAFPSIINFFNTVSPGSGDMMAMQLATFPYFDGFFLPNGEVYESSFAPNATYNTTKKDLDAVFSKVDARHFEFESNTYAAYVSDVFNLTDDLILNIGLRIDHFDQKGDKENKEDDYKQTNLSPMAGIVYQAIPKRLSLFTNYQTGFINNESQLNSNNTKTITLKPTKARQFEVGIKSALLNGKLSGGVSYYHIIANKYIGYDPYAIINGGTFQFEEYISKGIEVELNANPIHGLNLRASYAYNDAKLTDATNILSGRFYAELQDRRLGSAGPRNIYSFWADFKLETLATDILKNIGIGIGFNGASEQFPINDEVSGTFVLPAYTLINAAIYYDAPKFRIGVKGNNLNDEVYYNGWATINPQAPRSFLGTVSYKF